jgi:L-alanine-DL-glutamate epimerase-like enolase superfamily enzyme
LEIKKVDAEVKYIPLKTPFVTALRRVENVEFVRVSICFDDGSVLFGEAPATKAITGEDIESILNSIDDIKSSLIGLKREDALRNVHLSSLKSSAKAALDMALIPSIKTNQPKEMSIKTDITISLNPKIKMLQDAEVALNNGMDILKLKFGTDINHAIDVTKELSKTGAKLLIDANQAWSLKDTLKYIDALNEIDIVLIEQPVCASSLDELKTITSYSHIPIVADEAVFNLDDAKKVIESKSADIINIKLMKCGGVSKAIEILEYAKSKGVKCMLGSMLEGPISINAALHLAFNYTDVIEYIDLDSPLLYKKPSNELEFRFVGCEIFKI